MTHFAIPVGSPVLGGSASGHLVKEGGLAGVLKSKLDAIADPTTLDDSGAGYAVGSRWTNTASGKVWECVDSSPLAAVWKDLTAVSPPAGSGTELQYRNGGDFGSVSGSSYDGTYVTLQRLRFTPSGASIFRDVSARVVIANYQGTDIASIQENNAGAGLTMLAPIGFSTSYDSLGDVALRRNAAGVLEINNGTAGQYRDLIGRYIAGNGGLCLGAADNTYGLFPYGSGNIGIRQGSLSLTQYWASTGTQGLRIKSGALFGWSDNATDASYGFDTALARNAAGVVEINNGTAGTLRDLTCRNIYNNASQLRLQNQWTYHLGEGGFNGHTTKNGLALHGNYGMYNAAPGNNLGGGVVLGFQASSSTAYEINNGTAGQYRDLRARGLHLSAAEFTHIRADYDASNWMYLQCEWGAGAWGFGNNAAAIKVDASNVAGETRILLHDVDSGQLQRVLVGANGTGPGGVGRALYLAAA